MTSRNLGRVPIWAGVIAVAAALLPIPVTELPRLTEGRFFSDGATYFAMGMSLARDFDLEYSPQDLARIRRSYPDGPNGIFLKRASGGWTLSGRVAPGEKRIYFGKAVTYPILAAPFVFLAGPRGFLAFNVFCLMAAWALASAIVKRRGASTPVALFVSFALVFAGITPVYVFWIQPEVMNLAMILLAFALADRDRVTAAAVVLGISAYTKPTHLLMAGPLTLLPLLSGGPLAGRLAESARRAALVVAVAAAGFGLNLVVTGEWNYQGGERKTFSGAFPFDRSGERDVTFGNSGEWMTTMKLGPLSEGDVQEGERPAIGQGIVQAGEELTQMFWWNLGYFWVGRYGGMIPYFAPAFVALALFLFRGPRSAEGGCAVFSLLVYFLLSIALLPGPTNWYGGGGTLGNRYFTSVLPLATLFVPRGREVFVALSGALMALVFVSPAWTSPVVYSMSPARLAATSSPLAVLPAERTMLNDLSLATEAWRKKQAYDDVEGDPPIHRPGSHHGYWLYFPDDGTFGREPLPGLTLWDGEPAEGFRVKRGRRTEVLLRANEPVDRIQVTLRASGEADDIVIDAGGGAEARLVDPATGDLNLTLRPGRSLMYYDSFVYSVRVQSRSARRGDARRDSHTLVRFALHVSPRPRRPPP